MTHQLRMPQLFGNGNMIIGEYMFHYISRQTEILLGRWEDDCPVRCGLCPDQFHRLASEGEPQNLVTDAAAFLFWKTCPPPILFPPNLPPSKFTFSFYHWPCSSLSLLCLLFSLSPCRLHLPLLPICPVRLQWASLGSVSSVFGEADSSLLLCHGLLI